MPSKDEPVVVCVPPILTGIMWPQVGPRITKRLVVAERDLKAAAARMVEYAHEIADGERQLWAVLDGDKIATAWTTAIEGEERVLSICGITQDDMQQFGPLIKEAMVRFAQAEGCTDSRVDHGRAS
jgi:hypothetical protein